MRKFPNKKLIAKEIAELKRLKPIIRPISIFGDDNVGSILAQINVLENNLSHNAINMKYSSDENYRTNACAAREWLDGNGESETLSEDWKGLIIK